jgi:hypothetical protein
MHQKRNRKLFTDKTFPRSAVSARTTDSPFDSCHERRMPLVTNTAAYQESPDRARRAQEPRNECGVAFNNGPSSNATTLAGQRESNWQKATGAAKRAITSRIQLWDSVRASLLETEEKRRFCLPLTANSSISRQC